MKAPQLDEDVLAELYQPPGMTPDELGAGAFMYGEGWWRQKYGWFLGQGYRLRKRYEPGWIPSWKGEDPNLAFRREDGQSASERSILDATRIEDNAHVILKRVHIHQSPTEVDISLLFNSPELKAQVGNHCVPVFDVLRFPSEPQYCILVLPMLRCFYRPGFKTIGEIVSCVSQLFRGLQFIHEHRVAHRDCHYGNIMMDASPMYPEGWHFIAQDSTRNWGGRAPYLNRTECSTPIKYFFIDFGISVRFPGDDDATLAMPVLSGDKSAPELQGDGLQQMSNPFPTDVYYLGNTIRDVIFGQETLFPGYRGVSFMNNLIADMTQNDPSKRPTMSEVVERFDKIVARLSQFKLRSPAVRKDEIFMWRFILSFGRWRRGWRYWRKGIPAVRGVES